MFKSFFKKSTVQNNNIENSPVQATDMDAKYCDDKITEEFSKIGVYKKSLESIMRTFNINTRKDEDNEFPNEFPFMLFKKESENSKYTLLGGKNITSFKYSASKSTETNNSYRYTLKDDDEFYYLTESKDKKKASSEYPFYFLQFYGEGNPVIVGGKRHRKNKKTKRTRRRTKSKSKSKSRK